MTPKKAALVISLVVLAIVPMGLMVSQNLLGIEGKTAATNMVQKPQDDIKVEAPQSIIADAPQQGQRLPKPLDRQASPEQQQPVGIQYQPPLLGATLLVKRSNQAEGQGWVQ